MKNIYFLAGLLGLPLELLIAAGALAGTEIDPSLLNRRASILAPVGCNYRNIGAISSEAPSNDTPTAKVGGDIYYYDRGVFWSQQGNRYVVVAAPVGAVVDALPTGSEKLLGREDSIYYYFGAFYGEKDGKYEVLAPPLGAVVSYLPEGYKQEQIGDATLYRFNTICFKPTLAQGMIRYQVDQCLWDSRTGSGNVVVSTPPFADDTPVNRAAAAAIFNDKCSKCHDTQRALAIRKTETDWAKTVKRMRHKKPDLLNDAEETSIATYLSTICLLP